MKKIFGAIFLSVITFGYALANPYDYKILKVIDGDTVEVEAPFLPYELDQKIHIRIVGVDTPESSGRAECFEEREAAKSAKQFVEDEIAKAKEKKILLMAWDKYGGRIVGDIILDGDRLSYKLLEQGYGVEYSGGTKTKDWCNDQKQKDSKN